MFKAQQFQLPVSVIASLAYTAENVKVLVPGKLIAARPDFIQRQQDGSRDSAFIIFTLRADINKQVRVGIQLWNVAGIEYLVEPLSNVGGNIPGYVYGSLGGRKGGA